MPRNPSLAHGPWPPGSGQIEAPPEGYLRWVEQFAS
jgi:hypothetical protein